MLILVLSTLALVILEPHLQSAVTKVIVFAGYISGATIFTLIAVDYGRSVDLTGWYVAACACVLGAAILYLMASLVIGDGTHGAPPQPPDAASETREHGSQVQTNYVPAIPPVRRKYRSMRKRTLNAVKAHKPREHWEVAK